LHQSRSITARRLRLELSLKGLRAHPLADYLAKGLATTFVMRLTSTGLSFATIVVLSRFLGAEGYGQYAYIMAVIGILSTIAAFGMPQVVTREVASSRSLKDYANLNGIVLFSSLLGAALSSFFMMAYWLLDRFGHDFFGLSLTGNSRFLVALLLPLSVLAGSLSGAQQGMRRILAAQLPSAVVKPLALLVLLLSAGWGLQYAVGVQEAVLLTVVAASVALAVTAILAISALKQELPVGEAAVRFHTRRWASAGFFIAAASVLNAVSAQADIILLTWLAGPEAAGLFHVATRNAHLLTFLFGAMFVPLGPVVAELHTGGDRVALQRVVWYATSFVFVLTLPLAVIMIFAGSRYLALFGDQFPQASAVLTILAIAQLVNIGAGPVQMLLIMTGNSRRVLKWLLVSTSVNIILSAILIVSLGIEGAAIAAGLGIIFWNVGLRYEVRKCIGIEPSLFLPFSRVNREPQSDDCKPPTL
jgi:O-antigen/teichoic acid export membrane protein